MEYPKRKELKAVQRSAERRRARGKAEGARSAERGARSAEPDEMLPDEMLEVRRGERGARSAELAARSAEHSYVVIYRILEWSAERGSYGL